LVIVTIFALKEQEVIKVITTASLAPGSDYSPGAVRGVDAPSVCGRRMSVPPRRITQLTISLNTI
jgi:hypothetical protein